VGGLRVWDLGMVEVADEVGWGSMGSCVVSVGV
jgi:hypothetical protein